MKVLKQAIVNEFNRDLGGGTNHDIYTDVGGRLYYKFAPQNAAFPHIVFSFDSIVQEYMFVEEKSDILVSFDIWTNDQHSSSNLDDYFENLKTCFNDAVLSITGYTLKRFRYDFAQDFDEREGDDTYWRYFVQYRCLIEKN